MVKGETESSVIESSRNSNNKLIIETYLWVDTVPVDTIKQVAIIRTVRSNIRVNRSRTIHDSNFTLLNLMSRSKKRDDPDVE